MIGEDYTYMSERRSLAFAGYYNQLPVVFSAERLGKGRLFSYYYTGKEIIPFITPIEKLTKDENFKIYSKDGYMFILDISGQLVKFQIKLLSRDEFLEEQSQAKVNKPTVGGTCQSNQCNTCKSCGQKN